MESSSKTRVLLHPMAILSMSDHYSRSKARGTDTVMGGFFGTYKEGVWEAIGSFGIPTIAAGPDLKLDDDCLNTDKDRNVGISARDHYVSSKGVFPEYEVIGWYRSGAYPGPADIESHQSACTAAAAGDVPEAFLVMLDPTAADDPELFPLSAYALEDGGFIPVSFTVESNEAESVCVSSMASIKPRNKPEAVQLEAHMGDLKSAIVALNKNVGTIVEFLGKVQSGAATAQPALMRSIQALCKRLPAQRDDSLTGELLTDYNDVLLAAQLAAMTKCCEEASELANKFNVFQEQRDTDHGSRIGLGRMTHGLA